jgi:hypothetical protein
MTALERRLRKLETTWLSPLDREILALLALLQAQDMPDEEVSALICEACAEAVS